jgi:hypothetical protein
MPLPDEPAPTAPDEIAGALAEPGYVVVPDFLDEATGLALLEEIRASRTSTSFCVSRNIYGFPSGCSKEHFGEKM